jgi:hypothetical protein
MKLKLDLHPLFNDGVKIEAALREIIDSALEARASEVEIIPGKGSGALKKTVLRFLDRPEVKSQYHRVEKDGENWGRLFVHFRHDRARHDSPTSADRVAAWIHVPCACCGDELKVPDPETDSTPSICLDCPWCGSPNRLTLRRGRSGNLHASAVLNYPPV